MRRMAEPVRVVFGEPGTDGIELVVLGRTHPGSTDFWDGNWVRTAVAAKLGGFTADFVVDLRTDEFRSLRVELKHLYTTLEGVATFETLEGCVTLTFRGDGMGHVALEADLMDEPGVGNHLRSTLSLDQTYLPAIMDALDELDARWPVLGEA